MLQRTGIGMVRGKFRRHLCVFLGLACGLLISSRSLSEPSQGLTAFDHQVGQFVLLAERYEALSKGNNQRFLADYDLTGPVLESFARRLRGMVNLDFYESEFSCDATPFSPPMNRSGGASRQRGELLGKVGAPLFWAAQDLASYIDLLRTAGQVRPEDRQATCKEVSRLRVALACFAGAPSNCDRKALLDGIYKRDYDKDAKGLRIHVANNRLAAFKGALSLVEGRVFQALEGDRSAELLKLMEGEPSNEDALKGFVKKLEEIAAEELRLRIAATVYKAWKELPEEAKKMELLDEAQKRRDEAEQAFTRVMALTNGDQGAGDDRLNVDAELRRQGEILTRFVDLSIAHVRDVKRLVTELELMTEEKRKTESDKLHAALDAGMLKSPVDCKEWREARTGAAGAVPRADWGKLAWGKEPGDNGFGYRFTAQPTGQTLVIKEKERSLYRLRAELLVRIPDAVYKPAKALDGDCDVGPVTAYRAFDLGLEVDGLYELSGQEIKDSAHFALYRDPLVNTVRTNLDATKAALEGLRVPAAWIGANGQWSISENLKTMTLRLPIQGAPIEVQVLKDGLVTLDPLVVADQLCKKVFERRVPALVKTWASNFSIGGGDWRMEVSSAANGAADADVCKALVEAMRKEGAEKASAARSGAGSDPKVGRSEKPYAEGVVGSNLAVEARVVLSGKLGTTAVKWPARAYLTATPEGVSMKSVVFEEMPKDVRGFLDSKLESLSKQWSFQGAGGLSIKLNVAPPTIQTLPGSMDVPIALDVSSAGCAATTLRGSVSLPKGDFRMQEGDIGQLVERQLKCAAERIVNEKIENLVSCDKFNNSLFGWPLSKPLGKDAELVTKPLPNGDCLMTAKFILADEKVEIQDIRLKKSGGTRFAVDLSGARSPVLQERLRDFIQKKIGALASGGVDVSKPEFVKDGLTMRVSVMAAEPFGRIEFGVVTLSSDGRLNLDSELESIVRNKLTGYLKPRLEAVAMKILPPAVESFDIVKLEFGKGGLTAEAKFGVRVQDDLPLVPGRVELLPTLKLKSLETGDLMKNAAKNFLEKTLPLQVPPVEVTNINTLRLQDHDVALTADIKITLPALGQMDVKPVIISRKGVRIDGRVEFRLEIDLPVYSPPTVYLTDPGLFYDFRAKQLGALGSLTVVAPALKKVFRIDGTLSAGGGEFDASGDLKKLILVGESVVIDTMPVAYVRGELIFDPIQVTFDAETSPVLQKVFQAKMTGDIKPDIEPTASFKTGVTIFGAKLLNGEVLIKLKECTSRCMSINTGFNLPIGTGTVEANFGPLLYDARLVMRIGLALGSRSIGSGELTATLLKASLEAKLLKIFEVTLHTPGLEQMTPDYLAKVLASLLEIKLEDLLGLLNSLDKDIKISPVGSTGNADGTPGASGGGGGTGNGSTDGQGSVSAEGQSEKNASAAPPTQGGHAVDPDAKPPGSPLTIKTAPQRTTKPGNHIRACKRDDNQWGTLYPRQRGGWGFFAEIYGMSQRVHDKVCARVDRRSGEPWKTQPWLQDVSAIHDDFAPLRTDSSYYWHRLGDYECRSVNASTELCKAKRQVEKFQYNEAFVKKNGPAPRVIHVVPFNYTETTRDTRVADTKEIRLSQEWLDKFKSFGGVASERVKHELKRELLVQEGVVAYDIEHYEKIDRFSFFGEPVKVTYQLSKGGVRREAWDHVNVWVDGTGKSVLFDHRCRSRKGEMAGCEEKNSAVYDERFRKLLEKTSIQLNKLVPILNQSQTAWLVSDAIPWFLESTDDAIEIEEGDVMAYDDKVSTCPAGQKVLELRRFDSENDVRFRVTKEVEQAHNQDKWTESVLSEFNVSKVGVHSTWLNENHKGWAETMVSYLACVPDPQDWIDTRRPWLDADVSSGGVPAFYYELSDRAASKYSTVLFISKGQKPTTFHVMRDNEYGRFTGSRTETWNEAGKRSLLKVLELPKGRHIAVKVNARESTEAIVVHQDGSNVRLQVRKANVGQSDTRFLPAQGEALVEYTMPVEALKGCVDQLMQPARRSPWDTTGIIGYLDLESPSAETGIGPVQLLSRLKELGNRGSNISCQP